MEVLHILLAYIKVWVLGQTKKKKKVIGDSELMSSPLAFSSTWFHTDKTGILTHSSVG